MNIKLLTLSIQLPKKQLTKTTNFTTHLSRKPDGSGDEGITAKTGGIEGGSTGRIKTSTTK
ncbi:hypothetical protein Hanom_Chr01g00079051 [Helianthus anomalus]